MAKSLAANPTVESMKQSINSFFKKVDVSLHLCDYGVSEREVKKIADSAITPGRADNNIADIDQSGIIILVKQLF